MKQHERRNLPSRRVLAGITGLLAIGILTVGLVFDRKPLFVTGTVGTASLLVVLILETHRYATRAARIAHGVRRQSNTRLAELQRVFTDSIGSANQRVIDSIGSANQRVIDSIGSASERLVDSLATLTSEAQRSKANHDQLLARLELLERDLNRLAASQRKLLARYDEVFIAESGLSDHISRRLNADLEEASKVQLSRISEIVREFQAHQLTEIDALLQLQRKLLARYDEVFIAESGLSDHISRRLNADLEEASKVQLSRISEIVREFQAHQLTEIDALLQLQRRFDLSRAPLASTWAMSPRGLLLLADLIEEHRPTLVLECGPGTSTVYMVMAMRGAGVDGKIVGLEHDQSFAAMTRNVLESLGLMDMVEIREAPLTDWRDQEPPVTWYDPAALTDLRDIELVLIDGPPKSSAPSARAPAFPLLKSRLKPGAIIVVDDARRPDEQRMIAEWLEDHEVVEVPYPTRDQRVLRYEPPL